VLLIKNFKRKLKRLAPFIKSKKKKNRIWHP